MKTTPTLLAFLFATLTTPLSAQEPPKPGPEHQKLAAYAGTWACAIEMTGDDGKPMTSKGTTTLRVGPGGLWLLDDFQGEVMGGPFTGHGVTGYDPAKGKFVGTWVDSWSVSVMTSSTGTIFA